MSGVSVSTNLVRKARLNALSAKIFTPCVACIAYGHRCSASRPCKKCVMYSRQCVRSAPKGEREPESPRCALQIEHPLSLPSNQINTISEIIQSTLICDIEWAREALTRQRRIGFSVDNIVQSLSSVPATHHQAISKSLVFARLCPSRHKSADGNHEDLVATSASLPRAQSDVSLQDESSWDEDASMNMFMMNTEVGFMSVIFDPITGRRRSIAANAQLARKPSCSMDKSSLHVDKCSFLGMRSNLQHTLEYSLSTVMTKSANMHCAH